MPFLELRQNITLLKTAYVILALQNVLYFAAPFIDPLIPIGPGTMSLVFFIDLVGFGLLGFGYQVYSQQEGLKEKQLMLFGGSCFWGWVIFRIAWQFGILTSPTITIALASLEGIINLIISILLFITFSAIFLAFGSLAIWKAQGGTEGTLMAIYGVTNLVSMLMMTIPLVTMSNPLDASLAPVILGAIVKLLFVPILGAMTFFVLYLNAKRLQYPQALHLPNLAEFMYQQALLRWQPPYQHHPHTGLPPHPPPQVPVHPPPFPHQPSTSYFTPMYPTFQALPQKPIIGYCSSCRGALTEKTNFCPHCGTKLTWS